MCKQKKKEGDCRANFSLHDLEAKEESERALPCLSQKRKESRATISMHDLEAKKESERALSCSLQKRKRESHSLSLSLVPSNSVSLSKSPMDETVVEATKTL